MYRKQTCHVSMLTVRLSLNVPNPASCKKCTSSVRSEPIVVLPAVKFAQHVPWGKMILAGTSSVVCEEWYVWTVTFI